MKTSMIVVASEQIWPNLLGFLHWHEKLEGISRLFVYATNDERKSLGPARRLKKLIASIYTEVQILPEHDEIHGMLPQDVRRIVDNWMRLHQTGKWVINLTGGTKIMTAGLLDFADRPDVELIYRELGLGWFRLVKDPATGSLFSRALGSVEEGISDSVPLDKLIKTQFEVAEGDHWEIDAARKLPIVSILRSAIDTEWNWRQAFEAASVPFDNRKSGGMLFEELVAACLIELGVKNVMINAKHLSSNNVHRQEIDVLASHNGVLYLVDCKLAFPDDPVVPKPVAQIKEADKTTKSLGGLNAKTLMIRPSWDEDQERVDFAQALGVRIIQRGSTETLLPQLGEWIDRPLSSALHEAQALILDLRKKYKYPYSSTKARLIKDKEEKKTPVIPLYTDLLIVMDEECQDWVCFSWLDTYHFLFRPKAPDTSLKNALIRMLAGYGKVVHAEYSESKATLAIELKPGTECLKPLRSMLETKKHKYWLDSLVIEECDRQEMPKS